jgi:hypothetical protein
MTDTLMDPTDPRYLAAVRTVYDADAPRRAAARAAREAARKARTPAQRKADYVDRQVEHALEEADEGPTSYPATYMEPSDYTAYGARVAEDASVQAHADWDAAVALWNATPGTEDGEARYEAMTAAFGNDDTLWQEMDAMFTELGEVK